MRFNRVYKFDLTRSDNEERIKRIAPFIRLKLKERFKGTMASEICSKVGTEGNDFLMNKASLLIWFEVLDW